MELNNKEVVPAIFHIKCSLKYALIDLNVRD